MSIFSDYECGALSDDEFRNECNRMNRQDRYEREHLSGGFYKRDYCYHECDVHNENCPYYDAEEESYDYEQCFEDNE